MDVSIWAEDVEAASFAATAAAAAFLLSSIVEFANEVIGFVGGTVRGAETFVVGIEGGNEGSTTEDWFTGGGTEEFDFSWSLILAACSIWLRATCREKRPVVSSNKEIAAGDHLF